MASRGALCRVMSRVVSASRPVISRTAQSQTVQANITFRGPTSQCMRSMQNNLARQCESPCGMFTAPTFSFGLRAASVLLHSAPEQQLVIGSPLIRCAGGDTILSDPEDPDGT
eukprot:CAMPEP_0198214292 /NCGR_PEP_ID=MMETSP1445-20131203/40375_1 /TAXON_ID=36898 /ORGANISM="Pyramimonas sp., Strain CCMP2087" /LENGTH=112 /DNA_ID=CAMNT_0043889421 /DNA_START=168 /DNA_END=509 /DNA_ORIENTATION=+